MTKRGPLLLCHQTLVCRDTSHGRSRGPRTVLARAVPSPRRSGPRRTWNNSEPCRRSDNRLGLTYQIAFVRLTNRFPAQHPFEVIDELLGFTGAQLGRHRYVMPQT